MFKSLITRSMVVKPAFNCLALATKGPAFIAPTLRFGAQARFSSGAVDISSKVLAAVEDFISSRKAELEHYEAVDPADKEEVRALIKKLESADPSVETKWSSLGFDGLDEVEMVMAIESAMGVTLSDEEFHSIHSVEDAIQVFGKYAPKRA